MIALLLAGTAEAAYPRAPGIPLLRPSQLQSLSREHFETEGLDPVSKFMLTVDPHGKVIHCEALVPSRIKKIDEDTCDELLKIRAKPALDGSGRATYGVRSLSFINPDNGPFSPTVDLQLVVNKLPGTAQKYVVRRASIVVDEKGNALACESVLEGRSSNDPLDKALCKIATTTIKFKPAADFNNAPVLSVQAFAVEFTMADAPLIRKQSYPGKY